MRIESPIFGAMGATPGAAKTAHVIVLANEKGGSGKTTTAMHVVVALLKAGQKVAAIDIDSRQQSLSRYISNRRQWARRCGLVLELPEVHSVARADGRSVDDNEAAEFAAFAHAINAVEPAHDFIVIDTPGSDSYLMRLAHAMADTLITPLNDSFVDFDVLGRIDPESYEVTGTSHYGSLVREARRQRRLVEEGESDWIVMRNRVGQLDTRNSRNFVEGIGDLSKRLNFRVAEGLSERVVYRELFPRGLTALDTLDEQTLGAKPNMSHLAARHEVRALLEMLKLPIDERGRRRTNARAEWFRAAKEPLDGADLFWE
ncbi:MAG: AAA family ATPase [Xanthobacteraceae bacterium]|nr:AAA family ATPase [Xanthobacteraceae bacterium]QYK43813.1 MAG: AAA family ATPase [Xanthobacteraceae bacterium]